MMGRRSGPRAAVTRAFGVKVILEMMRVPAGSAENSKRTCSSRGPSVDRNPNRRPSSNVSTTKDADDDHAP
jgi:hypothetical protein